MDQNGNGQLNSHKEAVYGNVKFDLPRFPLTLQQRLKFFRQMHFNYPGMLVSQEEMIPLRKPKIILSLWALGYGASLYVLKYFHSYRRQYFMNKIAISPLLILHALSPIGVFYIFQKFNYENQYNLYYQKVGTLTDEELLRLEVKLNPKKTHIIEQII